MKILPVPMIREADAYTIAHEPVSDIDLMERAASRCSGWLLENLRIDQKIAVFCGGGNNSGDGLAIARHLLLAQFDVHVYLLSPPDSMSPSCRINYNRLREDHSECKISDLFPAKGVSELPMPDLPAQTVVIDAIFGSGLTRPAEGFTAGVIDYINKSKALVISIDVPSGLPVDHSVRKWNKTSIIEADYTLSFAPAKLAFFFPENDRYAGNWKLLDIGLSPEYIDSAKVTNYMTEEADIRRILKPRNKFSHKGTFGHVLLISGSKGKMGAAVLAARACLRSGCGLVTVRVPASGVEILQTAFPEAMVSIDPDGDCFSEVPDISNYTAVAIGPGIGTGSKTSAALKFLIQQLGTSAIFDADAINILSENKTWLAFLPKGCIFTPHPKEFERLVGKSDNDFGRLERQRNFSVKFNCYVVLKGAHTAITTPEGNCFFNTTGNPGMATGGSGDVLTGIIAGLLAQGYTPAESCLAGVYIHGLAGDFASTSVGFESLIASDIINHLGKSFLQLYGKL